MAHELTWFGHSAFKLVTDGPGGRRITVLIDPFLDGNPSSPVSAAGLGRVDCVLVTHDHGDHVGQAVEIATASNAPLVCMFDTAQRLLGQGLADSLAIGMNIGGTVEVCGMRVKMVQAAHSSATGQPAGYIITLADGFCMYHSGDTGLFSSMGLFPLFHNIELALLPIGGHFTMDPAQAAYACTMLDVPRVCPMHWGTFPLLEQNTESFALELAKTAPSTALYALRPGGMLRIERDGDEGFDCKIV